MLHNHGSVEAHRTDEIPLYLIIELIIPRMFEIGYNSNLLMFLFVSPQQRALTQVLLDALFKCHHNQTLRLVVIDEVHMYT